MIVRKPRPTGGELQALYDQIVCKAGMSHDIPAIASQIWSNGNNVATIGYLPSPACAKRREKEASSHGFQACHWSILDSVPAKTIHAHRLDPQNSMQNATNKCLLTRKRTGLLTLNFRTKECREMFSRRHRLDACFFHAHRCCLMVAFLFCSIMLGQC